MSFLNVENIQKSFGRTEVLKDISFSLEKGEVLAIIGSSGSGKTTLLRCLNFLETPLTATCFLTEMTIQRKASRLFAKTDCTLEWCSRTSISSLSIR